MSDHFLTYKYAFHRENIYKNIKFHMNNFRDLLCNRKFIRRITCDTRILPGYIYENLIKKSISVNP